MVAMNSFIYIIFLLIHFKKVFPTSPCYHLSLPINSTEFLALQSLYQNTGGQSWKWPANSAAPWNFTSLSTPLSTADLLRPCGMNKTWSGIQCSLISTNSCSITGLNLASYNLHYSVPPIFAGLPELRVLNLLGNSLSGSLSSSWGLSKKLTFLSLGSNKFFGSISPNFLVNYTSLTSLTLSANSLSGPLPVGFGTLKYLQLLDVSSNKFSKTIPSSFTHLSSLINLYMSSNHLSGTIPSFFSSYSSLKVLVLDKNSFHGSISLSSNSSFDHISTLSFPNLTTLSANYNHLSGSIPSALCLQTKLQTLNIFSNFLTSTIPSCLCSFEYSLPSFNFINIDVNELTGSIPSSFFEGCSKVTFFSASENSLTGPIPTNLGTKLNTFRLSLNFLSQSFPSSIASLTNLQYFTIAVNQLTGNIEAFLPNFFSTMSSKLLTLSMRNNYFTGSIPTELSLMKHLVLYYASTNYLTGPIPSNIGDCTAMAKLQLHENFFTGTIPSSLGVSYLPTPSPSTSPSLPPSPSTLSPWLTFLTLATNFLTGTLPSTLGYSSKLTMFDVHQNNLIGSIPSTYQQLVLIEEFLAHENSFTGTLPNFVFQFPKCLLLSLSTNCFSGSLPSCVSTTNYHAYSNSLQVLNLNGLSSGANCRIYPLGKRSSSSPSSTSSSFLSYLDPGYVCTQFMTGSIPSCLWSLPNLKALYLAGNGLSGQLNLPSAQHLSHNFVNLSLSFNRLTGTVPETLQSSGSFNWFDLSNNRFTGTLLDSFYMPTPLSYNGDNNNYYINVNRLSGALPSHFNLTSFNGNRKLFIDQVLNSNMFSFSLESINSKSSTYSSDSLVLMSYNGSSEMNIALLATFISILFFFLLSGSSVRLLLIQLTLVQFLHRVNSVLRLFRKWWRLSKLMKSYSPKIEFVNGFQLEESESLTRIGLFVRKFSSFSTRLSSFVLVTTFISVLSLKQPSADPSIFSSTAHSSASTIAFQQAWLLSASFLKGFSSALVFKFLLSVPLCLFILFVTFHQHKLAPNRSKSDSMTSDLLNRMQAYLSTFLLQTCRSFKNVGELLNPEWRMATICVFLMFVLNVLVVLAINFLYLQTILSQNSVVYPIFFGFFKSVWSSAIIPFTLRVVYRLVNPSTAILESFLLWLSLIFSIFNVILAPCLATVLSDSRCLLSLFKQTFLPPLGYSYSFCYLRAQNSLQCLANTTVFYLGNSIQPSFIYNFSCGSALIVQYSPLILYSLLLSGFIFPFTYLLFLFLLHLDLLSQTGRIYCEWLLPLLRVPLGKKGLTYRSLISISPELLTKKETDSSDASSMDYGISMVEFKSATNTNNSSTVFIPNPLQDLVRTSAENDNSFSIDSHNSPFELGSGFGVVLSSVVLTYRQLLHFTLLLTFGLACPYVGLLAAFGVYLESKILLLLLARRKYLSELQEAEFEKEINEFHQRLQAQKPHNNSSLISSKPSLRTSRISFQGDDNHLVQSETSRFSVSRAYSLNIHDLIHKETETNSEDDGVTDEDQDEDGNQKRLKPPPTSTSTSTTTTTSVLTTKMNTSNQPERDSVIERDFSYSSSFVSVSPSIASSSRPPPLTLSNCLRQIFFLIVDPDVFFLSDYLSSNSFSPSSTTSPSNQPQRHSIQHHQHQQQHQHPNQQQQQTSLQLSFWDSVSGFVWMIVYVSELFWVVQIFDMISDTQGVMYGVFYTFLWFGISIISLYFISIFLSLYLIHSTF